MKNYKIWKEILTEVDTKGRRVYSQGRFYLLWSILAYYLTLGLISLKSLKPDMDIDIESLKVIIEALQWPMGLFGGYVFGAKGLEALKIVMSKHKYESPSEVKEEPVENKEEDEKLLRKQEKQEDPEI